jgi:hypothetical protein
VHLEALLLSILRQSARSRIVVCPRPGLRAPQRERTAPSTPTWCRARSGWTRWRRASRTLRLANCSAPTSSSSAVASRACGRRCTPRSGRRRARSWCWRRLDAERGPADGTVASWKRPSHTGSTAWPGFRHMLGRDVPALEAPPRKLAPPMMHYATIPAMSLSPAVLRTYVMHDASGLGVHAGRVVLCTSASPGSLPQARSPISEGQRSRLRANPPSFNAQCPGSPHPDWSGRRPERGESRQQRRNAGERPPRSRLLCTRNMLSSI